MEDDIQPEVGEDGRRVLRGENALRLWRRGRDAWNTWIAGHHTTDIDFSKINFEPERLSETTWLSFAGFQFGHGNVSFYGATFGEGDVSFNNTTFGKGNVSFNHATFTSGASFNDSVFDTDRVSFIDTNFGMGNVSFSGTNFGKSRVLFNNTRFGRGNVSFYGTTFGDGDVSFVCTNFGDGEILFSKATFGDGNVSFASTKFGRGDVFFENTKFGNGNVSFINTKFGSGDVSFMNIHVGSGGFALYPESNTKSRWSFAIARFNGPVGMNMSKGSKNITHFDLRHTQFNASLDLKGAFGGVVDLRLSKTAHHVDISTVTTTLRRTPQNWWTPKQWLRRAEDPEDAARLRRLKEIAEGAKHHAAALRFAADENRASRWHDKGFWPSVLDMTFSLTSNYGQSVGRPVVGLLMVWFMAAMVFFGLSDSAWGINAALPLHTAAANSALLSLSHSFSFLPSTRDIISATEERLFREKPTDFIAAWVDTVSLVQSLLSFVFLFLIGLGLRNRFRL